MTDDHRTTRRAWRATAAVALVLASASFAWTGFVAHALQDARRDTYRQQCLDINARHDATVRKLDDLIARMPPGSVERRRAEQGRAGTVLLINAFLPSRDCDRYADRLLGTGPP